MGEQRHFCSGRFPRQQLGGEPGCPLQLMLCPKILKLVLGFRHCQSPAATELQWLAQFLFKSLPIVARGELEGKQTGDIDGDFLSRASGVDGLNMQVPCRCARTLPVNCVSFEYHHLVSVTSELMGSAGPEYPRANHYHVRRPFRGPKSRVHQQNWVIRVLR